MGYIEDNKDKMIEDVFKLVSIPSISEDHEQVVRALDCFLNMAKRMGFKTESLLDGRVGTVEMGQGDEVFGILGHVDVVDPGTLKNWKCPPFEPALVDGFLIGRGVLDDKGPIVATLYGMKAVMENGKQLTKKVRLIIGTQEEVEWSDMDEYVKKYPLPDYGFTPDGSFPVTNIEKGYMDIIMHFPLNKDENKDGLYIKEITGGTAVNIIPGECKAVLSNGEVIEASGRACHSSEPERGVNAIFKMAELLEKRSLEENTLLRTLKMLKEKFEGMYGKEIDLYDTEEYLNGEFIHRTVFAPVLIRTLEDEVVVTVNIRFSYTMTPERLYEGFKKLAESYGGTAVAGDTLPAVYVSRDEPFIKEIGRAYEEVTGLKHECMLAYGASYAKAMPRFVSWGPIFPYMEDSCHEENENISEKDLILNALCYEKAIANIAQSEKSFK